MNYLIAGLAKSGTTILFSRVQQALGDEIRTFFEPHQLAQFEEILALGDSQTTLTKVLVGRVTSAIDLLAQFDRHILIYRDPRDQFISMLLYLFYDFQVSGDRTGFEEAREALHHKVRAPAEVSTIELYDRIAGLVGRAPFNVFNNLHREQQAYIERYSPFLLRYEDLVDGQVQALEQYLQLDLQAQAQVAPAHQRVARSRSYGEWRSWLTPVDLQLVNEQWGAAIVSLGYELTDIAGDLSIDESTSLAYIEQFGGQA